MIGFDEEYRSPVRYVSRKVLRAQKRELKMSRWTHCGARQQERYGRQAAAGRLRAENGLAMPLQGV